MIEYRTFELTPVGGLPGFAALTYIGWAQVRHVSYQHRVGDRRRRNSIFQITLAGCGQCRPAAAAREVPLPRGRALAFHADLHAELRYGYPAVVQEPWEFLYMDLDGDAARVCLRDLVQRGGHALPCDPSHPLIHDLLRRLPEAGHEHRRIPLAEAAALANRVLEMFAGAVAPAMTDDRLVAEAMDWLAGRLDRQVGIAEAAAALGISREHLTRLFLRRLGEPPARWLRRRRLALAGDLLRRPGARVAEVARACGFATAAHLAHAFRRHTGMAPRDFRRQGGG